MKTTCFEVLSPDEVERIHTVSMRSLSRRGYFFDTPYHLNAQGREIRTKRLFRNLLEFDAEPRPFFKHPAHRSTEHACYNHSSPLMTEN